jgi:hypothetical protein
MATKKKKTAPKKTAQKAKTVKGKVAATKATAKKTTAKKPKVPYITTKEGMDALRYYCEGIMDLVGEYIITANPKISQKDFAKEAQTMIQSFFGLAPQQSEKRAKR